MLESLRRWSSGWVALILIVPLIASFAIWGISDSVGALFAARPLATVGGQSISPRDFERAFNDELQRLSQRAGQRISAAQARAVGLDRQVLDSLTTMSAIEAHAEQLGLGISDTTLAQGLRKDPIFHGIDGKFSKDRFDSLLRQYGLTEKGLLGLRRRDKLRGEILTALDGSVVVPRTLVDATHSWRNETRVIEYTTIDPSKSITLDTPSDETLKAEYEKTKSRYMTDPSRKLNVLLLSVDALKSKVKVPDEDVKKAYEATKASYDVPEKRRIQQIPFSDVAAAQAMKKKIDGGLSFEDAAKEAGASATDIDLGTVTRSALIDDTIADAAFALKKDAVSDVVEGQFAVVLLKVTDITEGKASTFDQVKGDVRSKLAGELALAQLQTIYQTLDDAVADGQPFSEISEEADMPYFELDSVTRNNQTPSGGTALSIKHAATVIEAGFGAEIGDEPESIALPDGGYAWVQVISITPAKQKSYDEVKDDVSAAWTDNQRRTALSDLAAKLVKRLNSGEAMAVIAEEVGGTVGTSEAVTRAKIPEGLTEAVMTQAFSLPKGDASSAETRDGQSRTLFRVVETTDAPPPSADEVTAITNELAAELRREQAELYVLGLDARYDTQINEVMFKRITGAEDAN